MKRLDIPVILLAVLIGAAGILFSLRSTEGDTVQVLTPFGEYLYPLKKDSRVTVKGYLGNYVIEIRSGRVHAVESNCPLQACIKRGWISMSGDSIVCIPNRIIVRIESREQKVDAVTE